MGPGRGDSVVELPYEVYLSNLLFGAKIPQRMGPLSHQQAIRALLQATVENRAPRNATVVRCPRTLFQPDTWMNPAATGVIKQDPRQIQRVLLATRPVRSQACWDDGCAFNPVLVSGMFVSTERSVIAG